jgi:hypothetical protein
MMSPFIKRVSVAHSIYVRRASVCIDITSSFEYSHVSSLRELSNDISLWGVGSQCRSHHHSLILSAAPITLAVLSGF